VNGLGDGRVTRFCQLFEHRKYERAFVDLDAGQPAVPLLLSSSQPHDPPRRQIRATIQRFAVASDVFEPPHPNQHSLRVTAVRALLPELVGEVAADAAQWITQSRIVHPLAENSA